MPEAETMDAFLTEIAPALGLAAVTAYREEGAWHLALDARTDIFIDRHEATAGYVISAEIVAPHPDRMADYHRLLLEYNSVWRETGGIRMALDPGDGTAIQIHEMPASRLSAEALGAVLGNFIEKLLAWRAALGSPGQGGADPAGVGFPEREAWEP